MACFDRLHIPTGSQSETLLPSMAFVKYVATSATTVSNPCSEFFLESVAVWKCNEGRQQAILSLFVYISGGSLNSPDLDGELGYHISLDLLLV